MKKKLYLKVLKDSETGKYSIDNSFQPYTSFEDDNIKMVVIENPPELLPNTRYSVNSETGELIVERIEVIPTESDIVKDKVEYISETLGIYQPFKNV